MLHNDPSYQPIWLEGTWNARWGGPWDAPSILLLPFLPWPKASFFTVINWSNPQLAHFPYLAISSNCRKGRVYNYPKFSIFLVISNTYAGHVLLTLDSKLGASHMARPGSRMDGGGYPVPSRIGQWLGWGKGSSGIFLWLHPSSAISQLCDLGQAA